MRSTCYVLSFRDTEVQNFPIFPIRLPHHATHDVIIIIKTFYMSSHTNGENFVSILQAVTEKNMNVLCRQTNRQTDRQTNKQTDPNAISSPNPSARVTMAEAEQ